jgi:molybdopterin converting factor small subunit
MDLFGNFEAVAGQKETVMPIAFNIPGYLRSYADGEARIVLEESPSSVREALELLWTVHPGIRDRVVMEQGEVRPHVIVFVGEESIRAIGGLDARIPDAAEITIMPAVSGG